MMETRKSTARPVLGGLEAAVLRHAPLGDVELGQHLDAEIACSACSVSWIGLICESIAVDAELDDEARGDRLQVDVARADLERVAQRRAHQAHDLARLLADRLERQVLDAARVVVAVASRRATRVERAQRLLVAREPGDQVAAVHQAPAEGSATRSSAHACSSHRERIVDRDAAARRPRRAAARSRAASIRRTARGRTPGARARSSAMRITGMRSVAPRRAVNASGSTPSFSSSTSTRRGARARRPRAPASTSSGSIGLNDRSRMRLIAGSRRARRSACT